MKRAEHGEKPMMDTSKRVLRAALRPDVAMTTHACPECGAGVLIPCIDKRAGHDNRPIKGVHVRRQFPLGMYEDERLGAPPTEQADGN